MDSMSLDSVEAVLGMFLKLSDRWNRTREQFRPDQYAKLFMRIARFAPCNFLVFGCGDDTSFWLEANKDGQTVFLENMAEWATRGRLSGATVYEIQYESKLDVWMPEAKIPNHVPESVMDTPWDFVLVDAPRGFGDGPGREQSVYMASELRKKFGSEVWVHDYQRRWERACGDKYLKAADEFFGDGLQRMGIWRKQ